MNDLAVVDIVTTKSEIQFNDYERLKKEADQVALRVKSVEVNEETVKETKKLLAKVNKSVKALEDRRKEVKRELLEPYQEFETKVKEIVNIVKEADNEVRSQVKELEEKERDEKKERLRDIWTLRIEQYKGSKVFDFEDWLTPQHLNKSFSINKAEDEMVEFLEKVERDIETLKGYEDNLSLISIYKETKDLGLTLSMRREEEEYRERLKKVIKPAAPGVYIFTITNEKDAKLAEILLKEHRIEFKKETR